MKQIQQIENRPRNARVIVENKVEPFFPDTMYLITTLKQVIKTL